MQSKDNTMIQPTYYGQRGDDFLLWLLFRNREKAGYFVEVGALDGTRFSNTYSFEQQGWTGICVEAHPDYIEILRKNRPNSHIVFAAAGNENGTVTFYANSRGSLSTLDPSQEENFKIHGEYFTGFVEHQVPMKTLTQILDDANAPKTIDVLSIDVEGAEMQVLAGMDWNKYVARVIIIEASPDEEPELTVYFERLNYHKARNYHGNLILCSNVDDAHLIASTEVNCTTIHTAHPLDKLQQPNPITIMNSQVVLNSSQQSLSVLRRFLSRFRKFISL